MEWNGVLLFNICYLYQFQMLSPAYYLKASYSLKVLTFLLTNPIVSDTTCLSASLKMNKNIKYLAALASL